jgi:hypothetical protein
MIFYENVPDLDRQRIKQALDDIKKYGDSFQAKIANFVEDTGLNIFLGLAQDVRGSGSVQLDNQADAINAVQQGNLSFEKAAGYVRLNIARETIDTGGQQGIEGTFVHEGKHAMDFAMMLSTFSDGVEEKIFNPSAYQREYSAHLTAAFYLMRRGGKYTDEGIGLGLLFRNGDKISVNRKGIRNRLKNNYGLTPQTPGNLLNTASYPVISVPRQKWFGLFS